MVFVINSGGSTSVWVWLGPVLLFLASMITLYFTVRSADQRARDDRQHDRDRDFRLWQRDVVLKISDEIVECAMAAFEEYYEVLTTPGYDPDDNTSLKAIEDNVRKIHALGVRLNLVGAGEPAELWVPLHRALNPVGLGKTISDTYSHEQDIIIAGLQGQTETHAARRQEYLAKIDTEMQKIGTTRDEFVAAVQRFLSQSDKQKIESQPHIGTTLPAPTNESSASSAATAAE